MRVGALRARENCGVTLVAMPVCACDGALAPFQLSGYGISFVQGGDEVDLFLMVFRVFVGLGSM